MAYPIAESPGLRPRVCAHLIVGARPEPFLASLCESLADACEMLIVNDNSPGQSPHGEALQGSRFAREGRLLVDRTPFTDFSAARNVCMRLHAQHDAGDWIAFVDADEVHAPKVARIAMNLGRVPADVDFVDAYTWHFFQSFDWYMSIDRRLVFFRFAPHVRWEGSVHEQLRGLHGRRIVLPYVYAHYGWTVPARHHAEKGRQYLSLGAPGRVVAQDELAAVTARSYFEFEARWAGTLRFRGAHPPAARAAIEAIRAQRADEFAHVEELIAARQTPVQRIRNALMWLNYEQRWRLRALNPLARRLLA